MTATMSLRHARILVLEDDYYLASDLQNALERAGAEVIGPFAGEAEAARAIGSTPPSFAFLDINLGTGPSFEMPRALRRLAVPFVFVTDYDLGTILEEFSDVHRLEKPVDAQHAVRIAEQALAPSSD